MLDWYTRAQRQEKMTFWACFIGWALDTYDLQVFSFFLPSLAAQWGITSAQTGLMGTAALLTSAAGGWAAGILSDRIGRVRVLLFTIAWFTLFGIAAGLCHNYEQLLIARSLQGLGFGGEWAVGAALMAEVIAPENRGRALGFVQSGFSIGWAGAAIAASWLLATCPPHLAWRMGFWLGAIPALVVFGLRLFLKDSAVFRQSVDNKARRAGFGSVFSRPLLGPSLLSALLVAGLQAGAYAIAIWLPTLLVARHVAAASMLTNVLIMAFGTVFGFATCAFLSDRFGRRLALGVMCLGAWLVTVVYMLLPLSPVSAGAMGWLLGFFTIGGFAAVGPFLSELFPTRVRTTCMGFSYNVGKTVGALAVTAIGAVAGRIGLDVAIALFSTSAYALGLLALVRLRETRGIDLGDEALAA